MRLIIFNSPESRAWDLSHDARQKKSWAGGEERDSGDRSKRMHVGVITYFKSLQLGSRGRKQRKIQAEGFPHEMSKTAVPDYPEKRF